jgi:hypothetical protein
MINHFLYVDPGSGSYLVQVIVAALLGAAFWIKNSWYRIKSFFFRKKHDPQEEPDKKN